MRSFQEGVLLALCCLGMIHGSVALTTTASSLSPIQAPVSKETCYSILVGNEDTCDTLPVKCGISAASFTSFNPNLSCSSLPKGKPVCCDYGTPTFPPKSRTSWCYTHTVRNGDTCEKISEGYKVTKANIEAWNNNTSAWYGCNDLQNGGQVCVSKGDPPMPVAIGGAVCGPQVPGTARPKMWFMIADLNPCPAGQCCSRKGQCGTGENFCGKSALAVPAPSAGWDGPKPVNKAASISEATSVKTKSATKATSTASEAKATSVKTMPKAKAAPTTKATSGKTTPETKATSTASGDKAKSVKTKPATKATPTASEDKATSGRTTPVAEATSGILTPEAESALKNESTSTKPAVSLVAKSLSKPNKDPNFFTTDVPFDDIPITFYHAPTTAAASMSIVLPGSDFPSWKVMKHFMNEIKGDDKVTATTKSSTTTKVTPTTSKTPSMTTSMTTSKTTSKTTAKATMEETKTKTKTKTKTNITKTVNGIATVPTGWELRMWDKKGCTGDCVILQGHNKNQWDGNCDQFGKDSKLKTKVDDESVSCRKWTTSKTGKLDWTDCHVSGLTKPQSWKMSNGLCTVSPNNRCDLWNDISQTYGWRGPGQCQDRGEMDPTFGSFRCHVG